MIAVGGSWRVFQYGGMHASTPQTPVYADPGNSAVHNLERLFAILQLETSPQAFYLTRNGARRYVDHRYFFGKLRAAHVGKSSTIRNALFGLVGLWFDRELFLEADVDKLIADAKAKPKRSGAPKKYDYTSAIISLIDHPEVRALDITKKTGNQKVIIGLLVHWYIGRRLDVPCCHGCVSVNAKRRILIAPTSKGSVPPGASASSCPDHSAGPMLFAHNRCPPCQGWGRLRGCETTEGRGAERNIAVADSAQSTYPAVASSQDERSFLVHLLHESAHILLHSHKAVFLDSNGYSNADPALEEEANA